MKEFFCADYSAIEARVLFWLADHRDGVRAFAEGRPIYEEMAAKIFNRPLKEILNPSVERELGKRAVLGCGYNMGWEKFMETCQTFGDFKVDESLAKAAVTAYRELHYPVPAFWKNTERAAISAVSIGRPFRTGLVVWRKEGKFLYCELPSKRRITFYGPEIRYKETPWGEKRPALYHWGVNSLSKVWECTGTYGGKLVENITQGVARDLMAEAMLRVEEHGYQVVLSVHDELLAERKKGVGRLKEFESLMAKTPLWATGLPVKVAGWAGERYRK